MSQRQKPQPIRIRIDRGGRLLSGAEASGGGGGGSGSGCGISKCRSFPRFLHSGAAGSSAGGSGGGTVGSGDGCSPGASGAVGGNAALLDVPFKTMASGLTFGGSASSMGSLGGQSSAASLDVHAPSVHPDSPASASPIWYKRSESCPCLLRGASQQQQQQDQQQPHQLSQGAQPSDGHSRSERASPVPPRAATGTDAGVREPVAALPVTKSPTGQAAADSPAGAIESDLQRPQQLQPPDDESSSTSLRRFTGGSALNRQTRRSRRKCEEWIGKLDYS